ncbi:MAG: 2'-5' RNA ligase [Rhodospirillaceae bacterium]|nr:MAG: 2'-5' RNA ligase [Rhodospirillaceae bacterium]
MRDRLHTLACGLPGARWIESLFYHVTVRFIGAVPEDVAEDIHAALLAVRGEVFTLEISGLGTFGHGRRLHSLWVGIRPDPALLTLRDKVERAVTRAGLAPDSHRYTPHVTLARLKEAPSMRVQNVLAGNALFQTGPFTVDRFILYSSTLSRSGAVYTPVAEYAL